jgi:hypothetical protein
MADVTYRSISSVTISTGSVTADSLYARTLTGDGSSLTNLKYENFATPIPRTSYAAYTIPWNAMETTGTITLDSANWNINGPISATDIKTQNLNTVTGDIGALTSPVIRNFYFSTNSIQTNTLYFGSAEGTNINAGRAVIGNLSTGAMSASGFDVNEFYAKNAQFSTLSTGTWLANSLNLTKINLYDQ